jgi:hypothetical protein
MSVVNKAQEERLIHLDSHSEDGCGTPSVANESHGCSFPEHMPGAIYVRSYFSPVGLRTGHPPYLYGPNTGSAVRPEAVLSLH